MKQFNIPKEAKTDVTILLAIGVVLFFLYGFDFEEMFERILEVAFTWTGYKLLVGHGLNPRIEKALNKEDNP